MNNSTRIYTGITLVPQTTTAVSAAGDLRYNTTSNKLELFNTGVDSIVTETLAATLTNKTIAAGSNTITGLTNTNLSGSAAITNANLAAMAANTVKANATAGSATPTDVSLVSTATASTVAIRDANANAGFNNSLHGFQTVTSAAGTTTLTVASPYATQITGTANQTVVLPNATTLTLGQSFTILNRSTGVVTVNANGGSLVQTMLTVTQAIFTVTDISTAAGTWDSAYSASSGLDINRNFSANNFIPSIASITSAAGTTVLTVASAFEQYVTGSTTQTVQLPVASTLANGQGFQITNNSGGLVTVKTSGGTTLATLSTSTTVLVSCTNTAGGTGSASWNTTFLGGGAAIAPTIQKFIGGSGTYTTPAGVIYLRVRMVGGGGGGSGSATQATNNAGAGGAGAATTFGTSLLVANGGAGGNAGNSAGGAGGTASLGTGPIGTAVTGGYGVGSNDTASGVQAAGGNGGSSAFGGAGGGNAAAIGIAGATNSGSGGSGGGANGTVADIVGTGGGAGGFIDAIITSPAATYPYSVGTGGAGGTAPSLFVGGSGAVGYIEVTEYYANGAAGNGGAIPPTAQRITSVGSGTYTTPAGVTYIKVKMAGGGGGGGGSGSGSGTIGGNGGTTSFGSSLLTATGGFGGNGGVAGGGGGATGGTVTVSAPAIAVVAQTGGSGGGATNNISGSNLYTMGASGGTNPFGGAGMNAAAAAAGTPAIANTGGGGGGGSTGGVNNGSSGAGGGAGGYIEAVIFNPSATYSYTIGAAGTSGTAGTSGNNGGAGGSGVIIVEEYYANGAIGTATTVTGLVAVANGGTGQTTVPAAESSLTPVSSVKTVNYALTTTDHTVLGDASSGGAFIFTLPTAVGVAGKTYVMVKTTASVNAITIATTSAQTVGGYASSVLTLDRLNESLTVRSDGSNWQIVHWNNPELQYALTITGPAGWSTTTARGTVKKGLNGSWRLAFNFNGTLTATANGTFTISNVTFLAGATYQACSLYDISTGTTTTSYARAEASSGIIRMQLVGNSSALCCSGDVELNSKPTFAM